MCEDYRTEFNKPEAFQLRSYLQQNRNWTLINPYPATEGGQGFVDADRDILNNYDEQTLTEVSNDVQGIMNKYLFGNDKFAGLFALLNEAINTAKDEQNKEFCSTAMKNLNVLYNKYSSLGVAKPANLTLAETYYDFSNNTFKSTPPDIITFTTNVNNDMLDSGPLMTSVRSKLVSVITSYKSLRNTFLEFYNENKAPNGSLQAVTKFDEMTKDTTLDGSDDTNIGRLTAQQPLSESNVEGIFNFYMGRSAKFQELVDFVQNYFTDPDGAIQTYQNKYDTLFAKPSLEYRGQRQLVASAPFAFGAPTAASDRALATAPSPDLTQLVTTYNQRYDYIRATNVRNAIAQAIADYWNMLSMVPVDIQMAETATNTYTNSLNYINIENTSAPNYPFTQLFMDMERMSGEYDRKLSEYRQAKIRLAELFGQKYKDAVKKFMTIYGKWDAFVTSQYGNSTIPQLATNEIKWLARHTTESSIEVVAAELQDSTKSFNVSNQSSIQADDMYSRMNEFVKQAELYFLTDHYKSCLNTQVGEQSVRVQNKQGVLPNLFGGTSRWAFF
jgi:hypothetical protein